MFGVNAHKFEMAKYYAVECLMKIMMENNAFLNDADDV